jgi:hypothetical protein
MTGIHRENETKHDPSTTEEPLSGPTLVLAVAVQAMLGIDPDFETAMKEVEGRPALHAGRPAHSAGSLSSRRLTHPLARLYWSTSLAEVMFLPLCRANSPQERGRVNQAIGYTLALDRALAAGLITGWVVCWPSGRFPKSPTSVRLQTAGGKGARERCLGELAPNLREYLEWMKQQYLTHPD